MNAPRTSAILVVTLLAVPVMLGGQVDRETIRHAEVQQQQLRMQVAEVAQQLEVLINEFERNGIGDGDEVRTLKALHGAVGSLSQTDMQRVVSLLQQSRGASDASQSRRHAADAYTSQKAIIAQLNQLMIEYRRQEAMYDLSVRFAELAERQNANLKQTVAIARETGGKPLDEVNDAVRLSLQVQSVEQESLHHEALLVLEELKRIVDSTAGEQRDRMAAAMRQSEQGRLRPSLQQAAEDLAAGSLFRAASNQQTARDQLRELARTLARPKDRIRQLQDAAHELTRLADEQQRVSEDARRLSQRWNNSDAIDAELAQADVVDRSEQIRRDLSEVASELAQAIRDAQDPMQETRAALNSKQGDQATKLSDDAAQRLTQAAAQAREELARAQQSNQLPPEAQAAVEQLLDRVRQLRERQETLQAQTADRDDAAARQAQASQQTVLQRDTRDVEVLASTRAPQAAEPLRRAYQQMHEAATALLVDNVVRDQVTTPQAAAVAALKEAESLLAQELESIAQKKEQLADLEEARQDIGEMMVDQQKLNTDTAREAAQKEPVTSEELTKQQEALAERAAESAKQLEATDNPAAEAISQAHDQMNQAGEQLAENQPQTAQPQQQQAMNHLQQAQQALDQQIAQLQDELGTPPNQQENLQTIADQLAQAQQNLTEAMQQLPTAGDLLNQQREIAEALQEMQPPGHTPPADSSLAQAQQAAQRAAEQIAQNQLTDAAQSMGQAQRAMEQAAEQADQPQSSPQPQADDAAPQQADAGDQPADQAEQPADTDTQAAQPDASPDAPDQPAAPQPAGPSPQQLQQLAERQAELQKQAQAMADQQAAAQAAAEQAAEQLAQIGQDVTEIAANDEGALPQSAEDALAQAADALAQSAAQAHANQPMQAEASAQQAQQAITEAQAAVAMAQSGLTPGSPMAGPPTPGQPIPGMTENGMEMSQAPGDGNRQSDEGDAFNDIAAQGAPTGHAFIGLPDRDRQAIQQSQAEPYPEEYAPQIEQYLRNLAAEGRN